MKRYLIWFCLCFFNVLVYGQDQEISEREQYKATHVSSETLMGYGVDENGKTLEIGSKKSTRIFDTDGNMTSLIEYNAKSQPTSRVLLKYSKGNLLIGGIEYKGYDEMIDKYSISYNSKNQKIKKVGLLENNKYEIQYRYNTSGNLIEKTKFKGSEDKVFSYMYEYSGDLVQKEIYWSPEMTLTKSFSYDSVGHLTKEENRTDKFQGYTFVYEYDSVGNKIKETKYAVDNIPQESFEFTYTPEKQIKSIKKYNFRGLLAYTWNYYYDDKNNLEFVKIYESEARDLVYVTQYVYRYFSLPINTSK